MSGREHIFTSQPIFLRFCSSSVINRWAANAAAGGGAMADIAARPGIVKLLELLNEDDDEDEDGDSASEEGD